MIKTLVFFIIIISFVNINAQNRVFKNIDFLAQLNNDTSYTNKKNEIIRKFENASPGKWGKNVKGVAKSFETQDSIIAFTFDACGGLGSNKYDKELINFLIKENIPATLFITGKWIDKNFETFKKLSTNNNFEIENHGLNHHPCSISGDSAFGIKGTSNISEVFDEIEANERKIESITGRRPIFMRSATAFTDEASVKIAKQLNVQMLSFSVLSGDGMPLTPTDTIIHYVLSKAKPGAIVIMHFNHPEGNTFEALQVIVPALRSKGYRFTKLEGTKLRTLQK